MTRRPPPARFVSVAVVVVLAWSAVGCGDDETEIFTSIADASAGTGVAELEGFVVERNNVAKLCEVLLESFPPQCGEPSVAIANPEEVDAAFTSAQGVSWTDLPVSLAGTVEAGVLTLER